MLDIQYNTILSVCKAVRGGRYEVREGMIPWLEFPFDAFPYALAFEIPEEDDAAEPAMVANLTLTLMSKIPDVTKRSVNNRILQDMREDTRDIWKMLTEAVSPDGNSSMFLHVERLPSLSIADTRNKLQGITRTFILEY